MQEAYIIDGLRTPIGKAIKGSLKWYRSDDFAAEVIRALLAKYPQIDPARIDDVIVGNAVPEAEQGLQMARWIVLRAGLPIDVPGMIINRYCGSGLEAIAIATAKIRSGMADLIIAGGTETMSFFPITGFRFAPNPTLTKQREDYFVSMGITAEAVAKKYGITREECDEYGYQSHMRAIRAIDSGRFAPEIHPLNVEYTTVDASGRRTTTTFVLEHDEGPRRDTSLERLAKLKPAFAKNGIVTAGNASQMSDGAAFVIVMSERMTKELELEPMGRLVTSAAAGVDPKYMGIGPIAAVPRALRQAGLNLGDIGAIELNEAFATQTLAVIKELGFDREITNPNGGAIALGHPLGATGARLALTLLHELKLRGKSYGLATACIGGGQGIAGIIERF